VSGSFAAIQAYGGGCNAMEGVETGARCSQSSCQEALPPSATPALIHSHRVGTMRVATAADRTGMIANIAESGATPSFKHLGSTALALRSSERGRCSMQQETDRCLKTLHFYADLAASLLNPNNKPHSKTNSQPAHHRPDEPPSRRHVAAPWQLGRPPALCRARGAGGRVGGGCV